MRRGDLSATGILNAVVPHLRRVFAPAGGVLVLTALPLRLLQIQFIDVLDRLRGEAPHYGNLLTVMASLIVIAFVVSLYGRAVFLRACHNTPDSWRELLRVNAKSFATYVYVSLIIEIAFVLFSITFIAIPMMIMLAGVAAAATTDPPQPGLTAPLRALSPYLRHGRVLTALLLVLSVAFIAVFVNLYFLAALMVWAAGAVPGFDSVKWTVTLQESYRLRIALIAASLSVLEPFFLTLMHVYADRVRSRQSGDDLLRRFNALTSLKRVAAVVAIGLIVCLPAPAQKTATITVAQYVQALRTIRDALAAGRFGVAALAAGRLDATNSILSNATRFEPDHALLRAASQSVMQAKPDLVVVDRLGATIDAFERGGLHAPPKEADPKLLERVRNSEKTGELMRGGDLKELPEASPTLGAEIERIYDKVIDWCAKKLETFFDWIERLWPKALTDDEEKKSFLGVPVVVWIVTLLIVATLLLVTAYVLRRSKRRILPVLSEQTAASERDADPLSRESNEWERYAGELASSGRMREAIRAWYHAVLVTLYRAGILHYRKGITNWEYVSALSPAHEWRPFFVSMTRQFDSEWYGRRETTSDILDSCAADARAIIGAIREGAR